tara:strand:- start:84 stop:656 length:573 start_codon:yes stop_codon:yes gene_type:complete
MKLNLIKSFTLLFILAVSLQSCKTNQLVSNGAYSDISLTRTADQYDIERLNEINTEGEAFWGIPIDSDVGNDYGTVVRFNGVELGGTKKFLPILTMLLNTVAFSRAINLVADNNLISFIVAVPIAGALNNAIWSGASTSRAFQKFNRKLVEENENIDVFLNPKYKINTKNGFWTSKTTINGKVMGATIKL